MEDRPKHMTDFINLVSYIRGSTHVTHVHVTDPETGALTDPNSITCGYIQPDGTAVAAAAMTKDSTGIYHFNYAIAADAIQGVWRPKVTATTGTLVKIDEGEFLVI